MVSSSTIIMQISWNKNEKGHETKPSDIDLEIVELFVSSFRFHRTDKIIAIYTITELMHQSVSNRHVTYNYTDAKRSADQGWWLTEEVHILQMQMVMSFKSVLIMSILCAVFVQDADSLLFRNAGGILGRISRTVNNAVNSAGKFIQEHP